MMTVIIAIGLIGRTPPDRQYNLAPLLAFSRLVLGAKSILEIMLLALISGAASLTPPIIIRPP